MLAMIAYGLIGLFFLALILLLDEDIDYFLEKWEFDRQMQEHQRKDNK